MNDDLLAAVAPRHVVLTNSKRLRASPSFTGRLMSNIPARGEVRSAATECMRAGTGGDGAELLRRMLAVDVLTCPYWGYEARIIRRNRSGEGRPATVVWSLRASNSLLFGMRPFARLTTNEPDQIHGGLMLENMLLDDKYLVGPLVGHGGMGAVYSAQHVGTGRRVAVKVILPKLLNSPEAVERFRIEARAAGAIRHPNVVDVTDFGVCQLGDSEVAYLVMEYLEGVTLRALIETEGSLPVQKVVAIIEQIALALDAAHQCGIVHRDLKPENIWLVPDARGGHVVRVLDFGIARLGSVGDLPFRIAGTSSPGGPGLSSTGGVAVAAIQADPAAGTIAVGAISTSLPTSVSTTGRAPTDPLTLVGSILGTPSYMSPEQCEGRAVDARSDLYSLGIIAYEALAGRRPFMGTPGELVKKHLHEVPEPLSGTAKLPAGISDAVAKALAKSPDERFGSARMMAGSLFAAAEAPSVVIRRAIALGAEEFPIFWRLAARAALPGLGVVAICLVPAAFLPWRGMIAVMEVGSSLAMLIVYARSDAFFASLISRMRNQPIGNMEVAKIIDDVRTRLGIMGPIHPIAFDLKLMKFYLREHNWRGADSTLAFLIRFLEGRPPHEIPDRVRLLAGSVRKRLTQVQTSLAVALILFALVELLFVAGVCALMGIRHPLIVEMLVFVVSAPLFVAFIGPVYSTAMVLLYFRSRQAIGEDVALTSIMPAKL